MATLIDGSWSGGGADYAEYFEFDGNSSDEDRRGYSVVLDGNKIRKATADDTKNYRSMFRQPNNRCDNPWDHWVDKYLRDDLGYIYEPHTVTRTVTMKAVRLHITITILTASLLGYQCS